MTPSNRLRGALMALGAAFFFGLHSPALKPQLVHLDPWLTAALMHLGCGLGLGLIAIPRRLLFGPLPVERRLQRVDLPWFAGALLFAGLLGPVLWAYGLTHVPASTSSLLLNLEGFFTVLLAWFVFGEARSRRVGVGIVLVGAGGIILNWSGAPDPAARLGMASIVAASLCWATDTNMMGRIAQRDPLMLAAIKGTIAGFLNLGLSLVLANSQPPWTTVATVLVIGFFGYGISLMLFILALREIGAASTITFFSTSPFIGSLVAVLWLGEPVTAVLLIAGALMALGIATQVKRGGDPDIMVR